MIVPVTRRELAVRIDHTLLKPDATTPEIDRLCAEALEHGFVSVCVNPVWVALAVERLKGSAVAVCAVVSFPLGAHPPAIKAREAGELAGVGARELDYVIDLGAMREGRFEALRTEAAALRAAVAGGEPIVLKAILETALLDATQTAMAAEAVVQGGVDFVKTSTGFGPGGATPEAVAMLARVAAGRARVKASGGIRTAEDARRMIEAGADRIGASASVAIVEGWSGG
jgi:deoxyribose-phosphate aldolase